MRRRQALVDGASRLVHELGDFRDNLPLPRAKRRSKTPFFAFGVLLAAVFAGLLALAYRQGRFSLPWQGDDWDDDEDFGSTDLELGDPIAAPAVNTPPGRV